MIYCCGCYYTRDISGKENRKINLLDSAKHKTRVLEIGICPKCGNEDQDKMNVARGTCGYIGTQFWNQGRTQEIKERVLHL